MGQSGKFGRMHSQERHVEPGIKSRPKHSRNMRLPGMSGLSFDHVHKFLCEDTTEDMMSSVVSSQSNSAPVSKVSLRIPQRNL
jgi:hypothetical protein